MNLKEFLDRLLKSPMEPKRGKIWPNDWKTIVGALLLYKLVFFLAIIFALGLIPDFFAINAWYGNFHYPTGEAPTIWSRISTWDAQHYLYLSYEGTPGANHPSAAFAQAWPWVIRAGGVLTGGNHLLSALLLSNLFSVIAFTLLFQFIRLQFGKKTALYSVVLMLCYPGAMFFSAAYAESLFLLFNVLFFACLYQRKYLTSALLTLVQPIIRAIGVVTIVPMFYVMLEDVRSRKIKPVAIALALSPIIGWLLSYILMYLKTGDPFAGSKAAELYRAQGSLLFAFDPARLAQETFSISVFHGYLGSFLDRMWIIPIAISLVILWRIDKALFLYTLAIVVISASVGRYTSFSRYICIIFPIFIAFGRYFSISRKLTGFYLSIALLAALQMIFTIRYVNNYWVG